MIDLIGFVTTVALGLAPANAPGVAHFATVPLFGAPAAVATQPPAPPATPATAAEVVDRVQKFYAGIKQVTALFKQTVTNTTFGSTKDSNGKVWIAKPGKMRWDYYDAKPGKPVVVKKNFISNGKVLYMIEHDNKQVLKKDIKQDLMPIVVSFLYGSGDLKAEFNAALDTTGKYGAKGDLVLKLTPKKPSAQYKNLYLAVAPDNFRVKESVIVDSSDNVNQFLFYTPDFETPTKDSVFEFDERSVPNYRVIDGDAPPAPAAAGSGAAPAPNAPIPVPKTK